MLMLVPNTKLMVDPDEVVKVAISKELGVKESDTCYYVEFHFKGDTLGSDIYCKTKEEAESIVLGFDALLRKAIEVKTND